MNRFCCFSLLPLLTVLAWGQGVQEGKPSSLQSQPDALVSGLYNQVVARHPLGIPYGADKKVFAPYLSKRLLHKFALSNACFDDWERHHQDSSAKPSIGLFENGIFSGGDVKAEPKSFQIEKTESEKDGSSRVYVRLTWGDPPDKPLTWYVAAVVVRENGHPVVDDVLYLKDNNGNVESSLTKDLSPGCIGARWVGVSNRPH
jgi:hypothetical protein